MPETAATVRRFGQPDERRDFPLGRLDLVQIGGMTVGRGRRAGSLGSARTRSASTRPIGTELPADRQVDIASLAVHLVL